LKSHTSWCITFRKVLWFQICKKFFSMDKFWTVQSTICANNVPVFKTLNVLCDYGVDQTWGELHWKVIHYITITSRFLALPLPLLYFLRVIHYITITWVKVMHWLPLPLRYFLRVIHYITITSRFLALPLPLLYFLRVIHYITITWVKVMH
jgi:hypothetical protein